MSYHRKISLKIVGLLETWSNIELHTAMWFLHVKHGAP